MTGFEPMALCTQNRCADQTALHLVSPSEAYRSTHEDSNSLILFVTRGGTAFFEKKIFLQQDRAAPKSRIVQERSHLGASSLTCFHFPGSLPATVWTLRLLRSGFEPLTQGFSVLCSNQLSYLNHFPKVFLLHFIE